MFDLALTIALPLGVVFLFALAVRHLAREPVAFLPLLIALACVLLYWIAVVGGAGLQEGIPALAALKWNWVGKLVAIAMTLLLIRFMPMVDFGSAGVRLPNRDRWLVPVLLCTALLCAIAWAAEAWAADGTDLSFERLAFQATLPGLDEELFFRGLVLALFMRAFAERWSVAGAPMGPGAVAITFFFAAGHGLAVAEGRIHFDLLVFAITGVLGYGLLWIRQRSGSVLPAVLVHNLLNVGSSFF